MLTALLKQMNVITIAEVIKKKVARFSLFVSLKLQSSCVKKFCKSKLCVYIGHLLVHFMRLVKFLQKNQASAKHNGVNPKIRQ